MTKTWIRYAAWAVALLLTAGVASAQTGDLRGAVYDQDGGALPGVTVTLESEEVLGGPWVTYTREDGFYQFPRLQPGSYTISFGLEGFATQERPDVPVRLDQTVEIDATLSLAAISESIVVTSEAPVVDPEQTGVQQTYTIDYLDKATIGSGNRSYQSVLGQAAGTDGGANPRVFGATLGENQYQIDGITTTDPVTYTFGTNFNFDAIQEIAFHTSGYEAEYGGSTGGFVNLITKSGGNTFNGSVDVRYRDNGFQESGDHFDPDLQDAKFLRPGATLGGPVLRERLWFFTAYELTDSEFTPTDSPTTRSFQSDYYLGKLSYQISDAWRAVFKYSTDPADIDNSDASVLITPQATTFQEQGGDIWQASVDGILGQSLFWDFKVGMNRQELNAFPQAQPIDGPASHFNLDTGITSRNAPNAQFSERDRDELKTSLTWFLDDMAGSHELKAGVEYNDLRFQSENFTTAGGYEYLDFFEGGVEVPAALNFSPNPGPAEYDGTLATAFLQDAWRVSDRLTVKAGLRYDTVDYDNNGGQEVASLDELQPRFGLAWDLTGASDTVVRGSWGRFMHPSALTLPSFTRLDNLPNFQYLSCSTFSFVLGMSPAQCAGLAGDITRGGVTVPRWMAGPDAGFDPFGYFLGSVTASEPGQVVDGLEAMYTDEWSLGVEHSLTPKTSIEVSWVSRDWNEIFEDTCNGNLESGFSEDAACDFYVMANLPQLRRTFEGAFVRFETRDIANLFLIASYTWGDSKGSVGYNQNAGTDFDLYPYHFVNRYGRDDREHRVKLNGYYQLPWELTLGFDGSWSSELPWEARERLVSPLYGEQFLEPRGSRDGDTFWQLDLQLSKRLHFEQLDLSLIGTVLNAFSEESVTTLCDNVEGCGAADLGEALEYQTPRRYEVGFRLEF
jgi:hypothetical protein